MLDPAWLFPPSRLSPLASPPRLYDRDVRWRGCPFTWGLIRPRVSGHSPTRAAAMLRAVRQKGTGHLFVSKCLDLRGHGNESSAPLPRGNT